MAVAVPTARLSTWLGRFRPFISACLYMTGMPLEMKIMTGMQLEIKIMTGMPLEIKGEGWRSEEALFRISLSFMDFSCVLLTAGVDLAIIVLS